MSDLLGASALGFIVPLTKIDVERRLVYGVGAVEEPDKAREIFDYATSKPHIEAWSKGIETASGGLSKGNLRAMHQKSAIGRFDEIAFDDAGKVVKVCAHVVDDAEWKKVEKGVYTGFSIGGGYAKKWKDEETGCTRYTANVTEISLVDNPCMPGARIAELVKAAGVVGSLELRGVPHTFSELWAQRVDPPATFAGAYAARAMTYGEMRKAFEEERHPREQGRFAAAVGGAATGAVLATGAMGAKEAAHHIQRAATGLPWKAYKPIMELAGHRFLTPRRFGRGLAIGAGIGALVGLARRRADPAPAPAEKLAKFDDSKHPRDKGRFASAVGGALAARNKN